MILWWKRVHCILRDLCPTVEYHYLRILVNGARKYLNLTRTPFMQGPAGSASLPSQLEITVLTSLNPSRVNSMVAKITDHLNLQHLKIIHCVCVSDPDRLILSNGPGGIMDEEELDSSCPLDLGVCTMLAMSCLLRM